MHTRTVSKFLILSAFVLSIIIFVIFSFIGQKYENNVFALYRSSIFQKEFNNTSLNSTLKYTKSQLHPLVLLQKIPLPNVNGRIDHMDIDIKNHRLFVAELENNSVDVLDLQNGGKRLKILTDDITEPQGVIYVPKYNKLFVSNGGDGKVNVFNTISYKLIDSINFHNDADNIRYDNISNLIYVGYGDGSIGIVNVTNDKLLKEIPLPVHPESFQIVKDYSLSNKLPINEAHNRIFINTPDDNSISIIDMRLNIVSLKWRLQDNIHGNFPMAIDQINHRLFVGTRDPLKLIIFDTSYQGSGKKISEMNISADPDDIFYNSLDKVIYISCGEGFIDIIKQQDANHYTLINKISTELGARTSLFVPKLNMLFVAVPHHDKDKSEALVLVYSVR